MAGCNHHVCAAVRRDLGGFDFGLHAAAREFGAGGACHCFDIRCDALHQWYQLGFGIAGGRGVIKTIHVREQHQEVGTRHRSHPGGQPVVISVPNLVSRYRIVLVDHWNGSPLEQLLDRRASIEIAASLLCILQRDQDLPRRNVVSSEHLRPSTCQRDLPDSSGRLAILELERSCCQLEHGAAERDGSR